MMDFEQLAVFHLKDGRHKSAEEGVCAMEAVAWLEGLPHADDPECTCPVIASYVRALNDLMDDETRQNLVAYLPRLVGTVSKEHELQRAKYLAHQAGIVWKAAGAARAARAANAARAAAYVAADDADAALAANAARAAAAATALAAAYVAAYVAAYDWSIALEMLDGVLAIGPQSPGFSKPVEERVAVYRELILERN